MSWALKGLSGDLKDKIFAVTAGMTLGRQGDIKIADSKASSIHARIQDDPQDGWILVDNNSKNGVVVNGSKISHHKIRDGLVFYIGDQSFQVIPDPEATQAAPITAPPAPTPKKKTWNQWLSEFLIKNKSSFTDQELPLTPLEPAVVLDFVKGVQTSAHWVVGYGPRRVGRSMLDLPILEPGTPEVCFELVPTYSGIEFRTEHSHIVKLNDESIDSRVLRVGDTIRINETLIEVDFIA